MTVCFLSERSAKKIRRLPVRNDLIDASSYLSGDNTSVRVHVTARLVHRLKRLGNQEGIEKLRQVVNRGVAVHLHNNRNRKGSYILDLVPKEYFTVERYYGGQEPALLIDCEPLDAPAVLLRANG